MTKKTNMIKKKGESRTLNRMPESVYSRTPTTSVSLTSRTLNVAFCRIIGAQDVPPKCVFGTGIELSLIQEEYQQTQWYRAIRGTNRPSLRIGSNQKVIIVGTILLHVSLDDARFQLVFRLARSLAVRALLQTSFINRFVKNMFAWAKDRVLQPRFSTSNRHRS